MIIVFGKANKILKIYDDHFSKCEKCQSSDIDYIVHQNYYHLFWIPIFPGLKFVGIYCNYCQNSKTDVINETAANYDKLTKTPLYMYSWIIIVLFIISINLLKSLF
jgi:hypothetical protein